GRPARVVSPRGPDHGLQRVLPTRGVARAAQQSDPSTAERRAVLPRRARLSRRGSINCRRTLQASGPEPAGIPVAQCDRAPALCRPSRRAAVGAPGSPQAGAALDSGLRGHEGVEAAYGDRRADGAAGLDLVVGAAGRRRARGAGVAGGAATHRVHDDERRVPAGGERGVHLISGAELLEADPRQLLAHRLHEAGVVHGDVEPRHIPRILRDSGSSITKRGMGSGTMGSRFPLGAAVAALAAALVLLRLDVPPVPTWFYAFAWYPTLVILDALVVRLGGTSMLVRPLDLGGSLWWSAVIWFLFEALNFRLQDWYYV